MGLRSVTYQPPEVINKIQYWCVKDLVEEFKAYIKKTHLAHVNENDKTVN